MNSKNLDGILDKINELRALFIFGQRVIPFLEELFYFVHDIMPVLEEINISIYESANKMPHASSQLNKVTQATELATTEILDNLESVLSRLNAIDSHFQTSTGDLTALENLDKETVEAVRTSLKGDDKLLQKISALNEQKQAHLKILTSNANDLERNLKDIRAKSNDIMISLQVQDITAQQIASVNHLIESVQNRLSNLIDRFKLSGAELLSEIEMMENHSFDPLASYDRSGKRQDTADKIMQKANDVKDNLEQLGENEPGNQASQDEIDRLFGKGA